MNHHRLHRVLFNVALLLAGLLAPSLALAQSDPYRAFMKEPNQETAFSYLHQVATHPRCANCHGKVIDGAHRPTVGDDQRPHPMNISSTNNLRLMVEDHEFKEIPNTSAPVNCRNCHADKNGAQPGMPPGAANDLMPGFVWHMPPASMIIAEDLTPQQLCENWLDPAKNSFLAFRGGRDDLKTFEKEFVHHVRDDPLIRWSWQPGPGRTPAPGEHGDFVKAMQLWIDEGANCPQQM